MGINHWINSAPLTMQALRGKVVLVDFWTYDCINCIHTLPDLAKLERRARAHRDDQHRIQRLAENARRDAAAHRTAADAVTAALGRRTDTRGDKFRMEIEGHVHTSRAEAGAVLFAQAHELIGELRRNYTIVIVTHSMQQAARISQRTAFFHLGRVVEVGETVQIFTDPHDPRTRDYITGRFG